METDKFHKFADGHYCSVQTVSTYLKDRKELIDGVISKPETQLRDDCIKSFYLRTAAWLKTLEKLNHPVCAQAILTAPRSLLEIAVDLILLHHDKTNDSAEKIDGWATSERMKDAQVTVSFYRNKGLAVPEEHKSLEQIYDNGVAQITTLRKRLWNQASHPKRWTGRNGVLEDIKQADLLHGQLTQVDLGMSLEELYCTDFRRMSWFVHSGVASVRGLPQEAYSILCGRAFYISANLGMLCAKITLRDFGFTDHLESLKDEWARIKAVREGQYIEKVGENLL